MKFDASTSTNCSPFPSVDTTMSENKDKANDAFVATVKELGAGYRGLRARRAWPRCSIREPDDESVDPAPAAAPRDMDGANAMAVSALRPGYKYRRPVPLPDDDDLVAPDANMDSAMLELETGWTAAANVPPHKSGNVGGAGAADDGGAVADDDGGAVADDADADDNAGDDDGDDDELFTAHSSFDTAEVANFTMDWDDKDGCGGQPEKAQELASSSDPATFQDARESSRSLLTMAAYFARTADGMLEEHKRTRKEADMYLSEVNLAKGKLEITVKVSFFNTSPFFTGDRVARQGGQGHAQGQGGGYQALAAVQGPLRGPPRY